MKRLLIALLISAPAATFAAAEHPMLQRYAEQARQDDPAFAGFSAEAGKALYFQEAQRNGKTMSCTTCHTDDPQKAGKTLAFRKIQPLAPAANPERFTDAKKIEKWFRRNCDDVFARECTAREKGDFMTWILTVGVKP